MSQQEGSKRNKEGLELNVTCQFLVYFDEINLFGENINLKKNRSSIKCL
jgi:hypothetical protein